MGMKNIIVTEIYRIAFVGKAEYSEKTTAFSMKNLRYHELIFTLSGNSTVYFNDQTLHTPPNSIRYLPAGNYTKYVVDRQERGECIDIFFSSNEPLDQEAFVIQMHNEKIATLFKKIFSLWVQKDEGYYMECVSILYNILAQMQKNSYLPDAHLQKIQPAIEYIQNNFLSKDPITTEKLVSVCKISYSYIKKLFALKYKISPKRYILQLKMNYACDLLQCGEYTVSQVAEQCGYSDIYTFSHQFKSEFGISPMQFIKKYISSK
jgi:AraC-like DNA-binding protein